MRTLGSYSLAIHGGAGPTPGRDYSEVETHLEELIQTGEALLRDGASAIDTVEQMVKELELSGLYVAGRGSAPNALGYVETDAAIMSGTDMRAGSVAAVRELVNPICGARTVMDKTAHIMIVGNGANAFCEEHGLERVPDPATWYRLPIGVEQTDLESDELAHGTVGAVAMDQNGHLAAATSTGGLFGKRAGRVGDTPLIGVGTWADRNVAVSCTGLGEYFMLSTAAYDVAAQIKYTSAALAKAASNTLDSVAAMGGDGGLIAIDANGDIVMPFNSKGMKRAWVKSGTQAQVSIF